MNKCYGTGPNQHFYISPFKAYGELLKIGREVHIKVRQRTKKCHSIHNGSYMHWMTQTH